MPNPNSFWTLKGNMAEAKDTGTGAKNVKIPTSGGNLCLNMPPYIFILLSKNLL